MQLDICFGDFRKNYTTFPYLEKMLLLPDTLCLFAKAVALFGCILGSDYKPVDFSQTIQIEHPIVYREDSLELRVAVATMISPMETFSYYQELLDFIGKNLEGFYSIYSAKDLRRSQ